MKIRVFCLAVAVLAVGLAGSLAARPAAAAIKVVACTTELADIAKQVGGANVTVYSIAKPNQDYHMVEPRPSDVQRIAQANLVVRIGLDLDLWMDALMNAAGNSGVNRGGSGYVDASVGIARLQVPHEQITGASGDIHVYGNPHYFYDPENGKTIARNILAGLERVSPSNRSYFQSNYDRFARAIDSRTAAWQAELKPYRGRSVVIYHESAVYFLRRFGLREFGTLEVKPGIPPSAAHIQRLIRRMKQDRVTTLVVESIYPRRFSDLIVRETGARVETVPYNIGAMGTRSYFDLIDRWVAGYKAALR